MSEQQVVQNCLWVSYFHPCLKGLEEGTEGLQTKGLIWLFPLCCQPRTFLLTLLGQMSREISCLCLWNCRTFAWGPWGRFQQITGLKVILSFLMDLFAPSPSWSTFFSPHIKTLLKKNYFLNFLFCIGIKPIKNAVIVSSEYQRDSAIHIYISILPQSPPSLVNF